MFWPDTLAAKVLIDVSNPLDFKNGFHPTLAVCNTDSLAEQIQREFPKTYVVKTLNTINCLIMVDPSRVPGHHVNFICGNNEDSKTTARVMLADFGWADDQLVDLGDLTGARATEMYLPLWLRLMQSTGTADFNIDVIK